MNILTLADVESKYLWDYFEKSKLDGVDLILSCGDLAPQYLSFLATFTHAPVLYVHGNHDDCYRETPPDGCICIEDKIYTYQGVRILGLGGSMRYKAGVNQYTQTGMNCRVMKLWPKLCLNRGFDILLTHAPAYRLGDAPDPAHTGFTAFNRLIEKYRPDYFIHGHVHANYGGNYKRQSVCGTTTVINAYEKYLIEDFNKKHGQGE